MCFRSQSCSDSDNSPRYSTSQPLPKKCHGNRRRGNSLTLYHAAVTNSQLRRKSTRFRRSFDKSPTFSSTDASQFTGIPELQAKTSNDSLDILLDSCDRLHTKNIEGTSTPATAVGDGGQGLRAMNIDDSLDILLSGSDCAVVPVSSSDSGCSSCESNVACSPLTYQLSPFSPLPSTYLTSSAQSAPTMSTSSSFNDLQPHCLSSDGPFIFSYVQYRVASHNISQGSVATRSRRGSIFGDKFKFTAESGGERISKIGRNLRKLRAKVAHCPYSTIQYRHVHWSKNNDNIETKNKKTRKRWEYFLWLLDLLSWPSG